jgi:hypothetical protein
MRTITAWVSLLALAATGTACSKKQAEGGSVSIDGSSTVFLISAATAERAKKEIGVDATVGSSGTGGGFKKFCAGEIDIAGASRPIKAAEADACKAKNVEWIELPVAYDGIAVVVSTKNAFVDKLTVDELKKMWAPEAEGQVSKWSQIRDGWPDQPLRLLGAGADSGTYDYFTAAIVGKEHSSRGDYRQSEDDNVLVQGVEQRRRRARLLRLRLLRREQGQAEDRPDRRRQGRQRRRRDRPDRRDHRRRHLPAAVAPDLHLRVEGRAGQGPRRQVRRLLPGQRHRAVGQGRLRAAAGQGRRAGQASASPSARPARCSPAARRSA